MLRRHLLLFAAAFGLATPGTAAVYTVGPGGQFATVTEALVAAYAAGGDAEIRIARGTSVERLELTDSAALTALSLRGGWDPTFTTQSLEPKDSVIDAASQGRALSSLTRFDLLIEALSFRRGRLVADAGVGGGVWLAAYGGRATFRHCRVEDSRLVGTGLVKGGGMAGLTSASPAANAGSLKVAGGLSEVDIDGLPRVQSGKIDIGAHESQ
jgi:hypothetical protein